MAQYRLISADSHVSEPPDLWATRCEQKYRERAPHLVANPPGKDGAYFYYEGHALHPIGIGLGAGKSPEELKEFLTKATYADARPGGWDPAERVKDNALDGVEADVLYTTLGFRIFWLKMPGCRPIASASTTTGSPSMSAMRPTRWRCWRSFPSMTRKPARASSNAAPRWG